jgi:quercetin dioxygenase-like cupin family protein
MTNDRAMHEEVLPDDIRDPLLAAIEPVMPAAAAASALRERVLARVRAAPAMVTIRAGEGRWQPFLPKVEIKVLREADGYLNYLMRLEAGARVPAHDHPMDEECLVLEGEINIGDLVVRAGDYHVAPRGVHHGVLESRAGALLFLRSAIPEMSQML